MKSASTAPAFTSMPDMESLYLTLMAQGILGSDLRDVFSNNKG